MSDFVVNDRRAFKRDGVLSKDPEESPESPGGGEAKKEAEIGNDDRTGSEAEARSGADAGSETQAEVGAQSGAAAGDGTKDEAVADSRTNDEAAAGDGTKDEAVAADGTKDEAAAGDGTQTEAGTRSADAPAEEQPPERPFVGDLPATFATLIIGLATTGMMHMEGEIQDGVKSPPDLNAAKHFIDILAELEKKTKGNLTVEEGNMLKTFLFDLRMRFVEISRRA
ncbi:MAG: DUF1844 domain-containing protein [Deltaproteobacteria bacterium]|jgi:hypothetical protein|nr:DUF1844 domain-containing protein [Deltaproteobacteria bacterium]